MQRVGKILPSLFGNYGIEDAVVLKFLRKSWNDIFAPPVSEHSFPKELKNGILFVTVNSHLWLAQLKLLKDEFLKKLRSYEVKDVKFRFGRIYRNQKEKTEKEYAMSLSSEQEEWLKDIMKNIKDSEMRMITENLIKKYLLFTMYLGRR